MERHGIQTGHFKLRLHAWSLLGCLLLDSSTAFSADSYRLNNGAVQNISEHGQCRRITNSSGNAIFIPTKTASEWSAFYGVTTTGVTKAACPALQNTWVTLSTTSQPVDRIIPSLVWTGTSAILWGGSSTGSTPTYLNTGGRYNASANTWSSMSATGAPEGRGAHAAVWTGSVMVVWGGIKGTISTASNLLTTGGRYDPVANTWTSTSTTGAPSARYDFTSIWSGTYMVIWGGQNSGGTLLGTGGRYNPSTNAWSAVTATGAPTARSGHTAVWTGSKMIIWGGNDTSGTVTNSGKLYDPAADTWTSMTTTGAPVGRSGHIAVWTGSKMIVWGGYINNSLTMTNTGGIYDPATNTWAAVTTTGAPVARVDHVAEWGGERMFMWGGTANLLGAGLLTGGLYNPANNSWVATPANANASTISGMWGNPPIVWTGSRILLWTTDRLLGMQ